MKHKHYPEEIKEYMRMLMNKEKNNANIARQLKDKFSSYFIDTEAESIRTSVRYNRKRWNIKAKEQPIKRLFFDLETSYITARIWRPGKQYVNPDNIIGHTKIICASYKWQYEDKVHTLVWDKKQNDSKLVKQLIKVLGEADEIIAHNGDRFDIKQLRTRAIHTGHLMYAQYRTLDTLKKARQYFAFPSNKLDYIGKALNLGRKLDHEGMDLWVKVVEHKDKDALSRMVAYCEQDVILLEEVYQCISPYIYHNTNFAVMKNGDKWHCPECTSDNVEKCHDDVTAMGIIRKIMRCNDCNKQYKVSNHTYMGMLESLMYNKG